MTTKNLKNRLNSEIENITPDVKQSVVESSYIEKPAPGRVATKKEKAIKRFVPAIISACVVVALAVTGISLYYTLYKGQKIYISNATFMVVEVEDTTASASAEGANPAVSFTADSDNVIESVRADNKEGEIILSSITVDLKGKTLAEGAKYFAEAAAKLGYIDVTATAETADKGLAITFTSAVKLNEVMREVDTAVNAYFKENGIYSFAKGTAMTKEELVALVKGTDANVSLDDSIEALNTKLAERKSYYEEYVANSANTDIAIIKEYLAVAITSLDELKAEYPVLKTSIEDIQSKLVTINTYIDIASDFASNIIINAKAMVSVGINTLLASVSDETKAVIETYITAIPTTVAELGTYLDGVANRHAAELTASFKLVFEAERPAIADTDYENFLKKFN